MNERKRCRPEHSEQIFLTNTHARFYKRTVMTEKTTPLREREKSADAQGGLQRALVTESSSMTLKESSPFSTTSYRTIFQCKGPQKLTLRQNGAGGPHRRRTNPFHAAGSLPTLPVHRMKTERCRSKLASRMPVMPLEVTA